jgi:hypothetical protein
MAARPGGGRGGGRDRRRTRPTRRRTARSRDGDRGRRRRVRGRLRRGGMGAQTKSSKGWTGRAARRDWSQPRTSGQFRWRTLVRRTTAVVPGGERAQGGFDLGFLASVFGAGAERGVGGFAGSGAVEDQVGGDESDEDAGVDEAAGEFEGAGDVDEAGAGGVVAAGVESRDGGAEDGGAGVGRGRPTGEWAGEVEGGEVGGGGLGWGERGAMDRPVPVAGEVDEGAAEEAVGADDEEGAGRVHLDSDRFRSLRLGSGRSESESAAGLLSGAAEGPEVVGEGGEAGVDDFVVHGEDEDVVEEVAEELAHAGGVLAVHVAGFAGG